jgi:hypothetical protein
LQAVAVLPYTTKWHATRCPVVQKALTKAMQIGPFRLIVLISSRGVEDLCLGKNVPWQLAALIEDQKCMEVGGRQWCIYVVLHRRVNAAAKALATLASKPFMNIFVTLFLANSFDIIVSKEQNHYLYIFFGLIYAFGTCLHAIINILRHYGSDLCLYVKIPV